MCGEACVKHWNARSFACCHHRHGAARTTNDKMEKSKERRKDHGPWLGKSQQNKNDAFDSQKNENGHILSHPGQI
jgi:hypothetical protein